MGGKYDQFIGLLQTKYGYTREHAEAEIDRQTAAFEAYQSQVAAPVV